MKKNLVLFAIFISLLTTAHFLEEVHKPNLAGEETSKSRLVPKYANLNSFKLPNTNIILSRSWIVANLGYPVSEELLGLLRMILENLVPLKSLPESQRKSAFRNTKVEIKIGHGSKVDKFILGDVSEVSGHFYVDFNGSIYVVSDKSRYEGVYSSKLDLNLKKYLRLKSLLELSPQEFIHKKIFYFLEDQSLKFAKIDSKRNRWYTLDFEKNKMEPKPSRGIRLKPIEKQFRFDLSQVRIKSIVTGKQNILSNPISEIVIQGREQVTAKLFLANNGKYGKFLRLSTSKKLFEIEDEGSDVFFNPHQHFWSKRFFLPRNIYEAKEFAFALSLNQKDFFNFRVVDAEKFSIESNDEKIKSFDKNLVNFTFNLLLNATVFKEADFVTEVSSGDEFLKQGSILSVRLFEKTFHIKIAEDLKVFDQNLKIVYNFTSATPGVTASDLQRVFTLFGK